VAKFLKIPESEYRPETIAHHSTSFRVIAE
jgi:hypothetical protein